ncbi:MAG: DUF2085 domain-containing protein [Chloroflexi bacterium]|nr:DUF2085 domain-containing protein [Chloroflexota bacterium]
MSFFHKYTLRRLLALLAVPSLVVLFWLGSQEGILGMANHVGYAVCHQITVRTYIFADLKLPLCARCTGQYLGAFSGFVLAWRWGRLRAAGLPRGRYILILLAFLGVWAFDGFNSYVSLLLGRPFLYSPHNLLRLITGMLQGLAVSFFLIPYFNQVFWREPDPTPILDNRWQLFTALAVSAVLVLAVQSRWLPLFYPLAILSSATAFFMLSIVGILVLLFVLREENKNSTAADFVTLLLPGMVFAALLIGAIDLARAYAEHSQGWILPTS